MRRQWRQACKCCSTHRVNMLLSAKIEAVSSEKEGEPVRIQVMLRRYDPPSYYPRCFLSHRGMTRLEHPRLLSLGYIAPGVMKRGEEYNHHCLFSLWAGLTVSCHGLGVRLRLALELVP